jgi:uncharacterized membrane protein
MEAELYAAFDRQIGRIERATTLLRAELTAAAPLAAPAAAPIHVPPAEAAVTAPPPSADSVPLAAIADPVPASATAPVDAPARGISFETLFAGRGLQLIGAFLVLIGTAFFLNLAFTRGWIGPAERIELGLVFGVALLGFGARVLRAKGTPVAESLVGLGAGILYLSLWASVAVFPQLHVSRAADFVAMVAVTSVLVLLAARRRSERVALLGLIGGFLTPVLLNNGQPTQALLAGYVFVLAVAFATLGVRARFRIVEIAAFVCAALYLQQLMPAGVTWPAAASYGVCTALVAVFAVAFSVSAWRNEAARALSVALLVADAGLYGALLGWIYHDQQTMLGITLLGLSIASLAAARLVPARQMLTATYAYVGIAAATLAMPALLHGYTLLDTLAIEGVLLIVVGARRADRAVAITGDALLGAAVVWLLVETVSAPPANTVLSSLALAYAIVIGGIAVARTQLATLLPDTSLIGQWRAGLAVALNAIAVIGISRLVLDAFGGPGWNIAVPSNAQVALSLAWSAYATALFGIGISRRNALLQREGLVLLAITIIKVFAVDLGNVDLAWRVVSFVVLGCVCMGLSAWYLRAQAAARREPAA